MKVNLALDTNAYSDLVRGDAGLARLIASVERVMIPFLVLAELRGGFAVGSKRQQNEQVLDRFLAKPSVEVLYADVRTVTHYAELFRQLRVQGQMIPTNDLWIAALVLQHALVLRSSDSHFDHLPQIPRA